MASCIYPARVLLNVFVLLAIGVYVFANIGFALFSDVVIEVRIVNTGPVLLTFARCEIIFEHVVYPGTTSTDIASVSRSWILHRRNKKIRASMPEERSVKCSVPCLPSLQKTTVDLYQDFSSVWCAMQLLFIVATGEAWAEYASKVVEGGDHSELVVFAFFVTFVM